MGPSLVFQSNQKGVGGDTSTEWPSTACWGNRWRGQSFGHTPHECQIRCRAPLAFWCCKKDLGPQSRDGSLTELGVLILTISAWNLAAQGSRVCNHCPTLQAENRLREGKRLSQGYTAEPEPGWNPDHLALSCRTSPPGAPSPFLSLRYWQRTKSPPPWGPWDWGQFILTPVNTCIRWARKGRGWLEVTWRPGRAGAQLTSVNSQHRP